MLFTLSKFVSVGLCATVLQYLILAYLVEIYAIRAAIASAIGFALSATFNYFLNRKFTFRSDARHTVAVPKFITVALAGVTLNTSIVGWFEEHTRVHYLVSQVLATIVAMLWNFVASAIWTFRTSQ